MKLKELKHFSEYYLTRNALDWNFKEKKWPTIEQEAQVEDVTSSWKEYIRLCDEAELGNSNSSLLACKLHRELMESVYGDHEDEDQRKLFNLLLSVLKTILRHEGKVYHVFYKELRYNHRTFKNEPCILYECLYAETPKGNANFYLENNLLWNLWSTRDICNNGLYDEDFVFGYYSKYPGVGVEHGSYEFRDGSTCGSYGPHYNSSECRIEPEKAQEIRDMGLIPVLIESGSYHENFFHVAGVFPEKLEVFKKNYDYVSIG